MKPRSKKEFLVHLFVAFFFVLIFLLQYQLRAFDDNRLTSWDSAFRFVDFRQTLIIFIASVLLAIPFSRLLFIRQYRPVILFLLSSAAVTPFWNMPEAILDASRYFTQAKHLELYGIEHFLMEWGGSLFAWTDLPVMPFIYGLLFRLFGEHRLAIQVFTAVCFSMTAVLTYLLGRKVKDEETGYAAGLLLCGIPYIFPQTALMMVDLGLMFFCLLAVYLSLHALEQGGRWIFLSALAVWVAFFCKYSAWLVLILIPLLWTAALAERNMHPKQEAVRGNSSNMLFNAGATALFSCLLIAGFILLKQEAFSGQLSLLREYQAPGLRRWGESFLSTFFFQVHPVVTVAAVIALWYAVRTRDLRLLTLSVPLLLIMVFQVRRSRYIIMTFPLLALMASYGLARLNKNSLRQLIIACVVTSSLATAFFVYRPLLAKNSFANLASAAAFLNTTDAEVVKVFTVYDREAPADPAVTVPLLDLFLNKPILYGGTPSGPETGEQMNSALRFTWKFPNPVYYENTIASGKKTAFVVISGKPDPDLPLELTEKTGSFRNVRSFLADDNEYEFRAFVTAVY